MNTNIYCPPHLRPGFNQNGQQIVSGINPIQTNIGVKEPETLLRPQPNDELIKFISDNWSSVLKEYGKSAYYIDEESQDEK